MPERHQISDDEFALATELAQATFELFASQPGYYNNTLNTHLRGKLGEIAVSAFFKKSGVPTKELWRNIDLIAEADIEIGGRSRADVKTWDVHHWPNLGRCISVYQFPALRRKADLVIWCTSETAIRPEMTVSIEGWNTMGDIEQSPKRYTGPPGGRQVFNHQLELVALRDLDSLLKSQNA